MRGHAPGLEKIEINQARPRSHVKFTTRNARKKKEGPSLDARVRILPYIRRRPAGSLPAGRIGGPNGSIPDATLQGKLGARRRARGRGRGGKCHARRGRGLALLDEREPLSVDVKRRSYLKVGSRDPGRCRRGRCCFALRLLPKKYKMHEGSGRIYGFARIPSLRCLTAP